MKYPTVKAKKNETILNLVKRVTYKNKKSGEIVIKYDK